MRFKKEARAAAKLNHPNIVQIHDFNTHEGCSYMVMEYVEGCNLKQLLQREGILPAGDAINLMIQACYALAHAHEAGVIHRDIKPDNFILGDIGYLKLADLGLAKIGLVGDPSSMGMTLSGGPLGTPYYISPEQVQAEPVDHRTDIYSLGATFFHLLAGSPPFNGKSSPLIMAKHLNEPPEDPFKLNPDIDPVLAEVLLHMMQKSLDDRPQSVMEVCHRLLIHQQLIEKESLQKQIARVMEIAPADDGVVAPVSEDVPLKAVPDSTPGNSAVPDKTVSLNVSPVDSFVGLPSTNPAAEKGIQPPLREEGLFPQGLFQELVRELHFALADETTSLVDEAFESTGTSRTTLKKEEFPDFTRALMKHVSNITQREKVRETCEKIRKRAEKDDVVSLDPREECLSLLYMTQLRRLLKRLAPNSAFDIVDECIDILDLTPRKIPVSRREELLDEIEHQLGKLPVKKQFRTEVQYIALR